MHSFFVIFLLLEVCLEISLVNSQHKNTTKITTTSSKITTKGPPQTTAIVIPPYCNYKREHHTLHITHHTLQGGTGGTSKGEHLVFVPNLNIEIIRSIGQFRKKISVRVLVAHHCLVKIVIAEVSVVNVLKINAMDSAFCGFGILG